MSDARAHTALAGRGGLQTRGNTAERGNNRKCLTGVRQARRTPSAYSGESSALSCARVAEAAVAGRVAAAYQGTALYGRDIGWLRCGAIGRQLAIPVVGDPAVTEGGAAGLRVDPEDVEHFLHHGHHALPFLHGVLLP